eukprot:363340-Chlamydomonas_euryale.AAC.1
MEAAPRIISWKLLPPNLEVAPQPVTWKLLHAPPGSCAPPPGSCSPPYLEVVQVVARNRLEAVVQQAAVCALARACEPTLHRASACVAHASRVRRRQRQWRLKT